jgi:hypothetical protein
VSYGVSPPVRLKHAVWHGNDNQENSSSHQTSAAATQAARETSAQFEQKIVLLKKDAESDGKLAALQIKTLEATIAQLTAQLSDVHKQFAEAKQQVQDIAVKAIEGASGANALAHVNQIAIEQAKQRSSQS